MCIVEFVKRLYDFMGIYKIFWSQNSHYRYLPIFYRYFIDIFSEIPVQTPVLHSRDFSVEKSVFSDFTDFSPIFLLVAFSSTFSSRCRPKTNFSAIYRSKKPIFLSLIITMTGLFYISLVVEFNFSWCFHWSHHWCYSW